MPPALGIYSFRQSASKGHFSGLLLSCYSKSVGYGKCDLIVSFAWKRQAGIRRAAVTRCWGSWRTLTVREQNGQSAAQEDARNDLDDMRK